MSVQQTFTCDSCGHAVLVPPDPAPADWWALGRFKDGHFVCDKHICAKCYDRVFTYKVVAEMRVQ